jgi:hypothetical protein
MFNPNDFLSAPIVNGVASAAGGVPNRGVPLPKSRTDFIARRRSDDEIMLGGAQGQADRSKTEIIRSHTSPAAVQHTPQAPAPNSGAGPGLGAWMGTHYSQQSQGLNPPGQNQYTTAGTGLGQNQFAGWFLSFFLFFVCFVLKFSLSLFFFSFYFFSFFFFYFVTNISFIYFILSSHIPTSLDSSTHHPLVFVCFRFVFAFMLLFFSLLSFAVVIMRLLFLLLCVQA